MLPLHTFSEIRGELNSSPLKVLSLSEALTQKFPIEKTAVLLTENDKKVSLRALKDLGFAAVLTIDPNHQSDPEGLPTILSIRNPEVIKSGDVIRPRNDNGQLKVLYRRGANAHSLFVTERCNSKCLMCSQPPREEDDLWLTQEILDFIPLIDKDIPFLGITGGEPTLLRGRLSEIIDKCKYCLPGVPLHILSNGRNFSDVQFVKTFDKAKGHVTWAVPLYSDLPHIHDFVVQADNAHRDTVNGIYNLAEHGHKIEIRIVLHKQTIPGLMRYVEHLCRNFPFVSHVALMGLEPMGYAKINREQLWIDPADYTELLSEATLYLARRGMNVSIYNIPLCILPKSVWQFARQSISDWKNIYALECEGCDLRTQCCGFFSSYGANWKSRAIKPFKAEVTK